MSLLSNLLEVCTDAVSHFGVIETHDYTIIFDDGDVDNINFYDILGEVIETIPLPKK